MSVERPFFPNEPIRKVDVVPKSAAPNSSERDGQMYFWDNTVEFPDAFRKSNKQLPIIAPEDKSYILDFRAKKAALKNSPKQGTLNLFEQPSQVNNEFHWPEEDITEGSGYRLLGSNEDLQDYAEESENNQAYWRTRRRGLVTRVIELNHTGSLLHRRLLKSFGFRDYDGKPVLNSNNTDSLHWPEEDPDDGRGWSIPTKRQPKRVIKPILTASVVFDRPKDGTSSKSVFAEDKPDYIPDEYYQDWSIGMQRITEYGTNKATTHFIQKHMDFPVGRGIARLFTTFSDIASYRILIHGTYARMGKIERLARAHGRNYKEALHVGLFERNLDPINKIIKRTESDTGRWRDIDELALEIGRTRFRTPDLSTIFNKVETVADEKGPKVHAKNFAASCLAGGVYRNPGVTEVSLGGMSLLMAEPIIVNAAYILTHTELIKALTNVNTAEQFVSALGYLIATGIIPYTLVLPYIAIHENLHHYSADRNGLGFINARLIKKETIPGLVNLEPQPKEE